MADANMTLLSRNDIDYIVDKTTGRIAFVVKAPDGTHATVERGYTGVRDLSGQVTGLTGGKIMVARDGATVVWTFQDVTIASDYAKLLETAPENATMFLPDSGMLSAPLVQENGDPIARAAVTSGGVMAIWGATGAQINNGFITYTVNRAWGTGLPGVAQGTGVIYL